MRGYSQGGRFSSDFESSSISVGINHDLQRPAGTVAQWYVFDPINSSVDTLYDVGSADGTGRRWRGPYILPVVRSVITQGSIPMSDRGFYNTDVLHLTLNADDVDKVVPDVIGNPDLQNRGRIVWLNEVFRPVRVQQSGIVKDRFSLIVVDCQQVMSEELVNDPQFQQYAGTYDSPSSATQVVLPPGYGYGSTPYGDDTPNNINGYGD